MRQVIFLLFCLLNSGLFAQENTENKRAINKSDSLIQETPLALVHRQIAAYNARDIDAFMDTYADDIETYIFPDKLLSKGKDIMRKDFAAMFERTPGLYCEIKEVITQGNIVIFKESVLGFGKNPLVVTAIYHVENCRIKKLYFIY